MNEQKTQSYKKIGITLFIVVVFSALFFIAWQLFSVDREPQLTHPKQLGVEQHNPILADTPVTPTPSQKLLTVPFTPQAPTANWDELHNEACEEASAIMANAYFSNITTLSAADVESEIATLTDWQNAELGYHLSITTQEAATMMESVYQLSAQIVPLSETTIKTALTNNKLVIFPANGRLLRNPYFKQPGPIYHMLVITGYDELGFITNDPGTKRGLNYRYDYKTLSAANGTWSHALQKVDLDQKNIIIISA